jgi:hypothetical protein
MRIISPDNSRIIRAREQSVFAVHGHRTAYLAVATALLALVVSCVSTGAPKLSESSVSRIVDGETTKSEVSSLLGKPEQILILDKESLEHYIARVATIHPADLGFPDGHYEVWTYSRWSHVAGLMLFPSYETAKLCMLIINSDGICLKKLYVEESHMKF